MEDPLEEGMATHSCILAWGIPWTEAPARPEPLQRGRGSGGGASAFRRLDFGGAGGLVLRPSAGEPGC